LASGSWDNTIRVWDVASGAELATLRGHTERVSSVTFSLDGTRLASGSDDKTVKVWDMSPLGQSLSTRGEPLILWSVGPPALMVEDLNLEGSLGLSKENQRLLKQKGALVDEDGAEGEETKVSAAAASATAGESGAFLLRTHNAIFPVAQHQWRNGAVQIEYANEVQNFFEGMVELLEANEQEQIALEEGPYKDSLATPEGRIVEEKESILRVYRNVAPERLNTFITRMGEYVDLADDGEKAWRVEEYETLVKMLNAVKEHRAFLQTLQTDNGLLYEQLQSLAELGGEHASVAQALLYVFNDKAVDLLIAA